MERRCCAMALLLALGLQLSSLALLASASASDHRYKEGEKVPLYANKVGPFHNPRYASFCVSSPCGDGSFCSSEDGHNGSVPCAPV